MLFLNKIDFTIYHINEIFSSFVSLSINTKFKININNNFSQQFSFFQFQ
jgi:hypothetical protein